MKFSLEQIQQALTIMEALTSAKVENPILDSVQGYAAKVPDYRKVIVRSKDAGVQYGELVGYEGSTVHLRNARQMWSWTASEGGTLLDCANHGVKAGKFSTVSSAVTVIGACAIIDVAEKAVKSLESAKWG